MREFLPQRAFLVIVMALGIIVLTPTPLLADTAFAWFAIVEISLVVLLIPVILIESVVFRIRLRLGWLRALGVSACANLVSTGAAIVSLEVIFENRKPFLITGAEALMPFLAMLFLLFFVSSWVEYRVAVWMLRHERSGSGILSPKPAPTGSEPLSPAAALRPTAHLLRTVLNGKVASYLFLTVIGGWLILNNNGSGVAPQASPVGSLRTINTAEVTYSSTYTTGSSATLANLDGTASPSTAESAGLIDSILASGVKSNYRFVYTPGPKEKGQITTYTITASPVQGPGNGNFYFSDQTGVIRMNPSRPANATDSPLAG